MTDAQLVAEASAGKESAYAALVGRYHPMCIRFSRHLLGPEADVEDLVQETFVRAFGALPRYSERETFRSWLFRILLNRCRSAGARQSRARTRFVRDDAAMRVASARGGERLVDVNLTLARVLTGLDLDHREAFLLKVGEEMEYDEISLLTGVGVPALKMRVKRARDHVRAHWPEDGHD